METVLSKDRSYRFCHHCQGLLGFQVVYQETDLHIQAKDDLQTHAMELVKRCRHQIETYARLYLDFLTALTPLPLDPHAPEIVQKMLMAGRTAGTGPMASVAGAIAQYVGEGLLPMSEEVIVENGGDIYIRVNRPVTVGIFAGDSVFSNRIGIKLEPKEAALGICTSSGRIGHSLSFGQAHAVSIISESAPLADAVATSAGNRIQKPEDMEQVVEWARKIKGVIGGVFILDDKLSAWGELELVLL